MRAFKENPTWGELHNAAMRLASNAHVHERYGRLEIARTLYEQAAKFEEEALQICDPSKLRTLQITRESLRWLKEKAKDPNPK